jgi:hypothetical protein
MGTCAVNASTGWKWLRCVTCSAYVAKLDHMVACKIVRVTRYVRHAPVPSLAASSRTQSASGPRAIAPTATPGSSSLAWQWCEETPSSMLVGSTIDVPPVTVSSMTAPGTSWNCTPCMPSPARTLRASVSISSCDAIVGQHSHGHRLESNVPRRRSSRDSSTMPR